MATQVSSQIAIVGGGIAGLWLLNRLRLAGYDAVLFEKNALGSGQTLASQGIIHGGLKYALNGVLNPASSAIANMPERWRKCLDATGEVDLRNTTVLSPHYYMWSSGSVRSRLKTFLGSKALHGRIDALPTDQYPEFLRNIRSERTSTKGTLYKLNDFVIDTPSLIRNLAHNNIEHIFKCHDVRLQQENNMQTLIVDDSYGSSVSVNADKIILCAGEGNESLLESQRGLSPGTQMQRRPLHMVAIKTDYPHPAYMHCIGNSFGMTPRLTITAHPCEKSEGSNAQQWVWYLGGEIAETGINRDTETQLAFAFKELASLLPWLDFTRAQGYTFLINRAEPRIHNLQRPDNAYVEQCNNVLVCWPTKLSLCPNLGDQVMSFLTNTLPTPASQINESASGTQLAIHFSRPDFALPAWESAFEH